MAKLTLLEMTQDILSALEADTVTSISDTPESDEVAQTIQSVFTQMIANQTIPVLDELFQFADATAKVFFLMPDTIGEINYWNYNSKKSGDTQDAFVPIYFQNPEDFLNALNKRDSSNTSYEYVTDPTSTTVQLLIQKDKAPQYWTSFDDTYIVCDSYDSAIDTTGLLGSKSQGHGKKIVTWSATDSYTPPIAENYFPLLVAEAKSTCFVNMKQSANPKVEKQARNMRLWLQNDKFRTRQAEKASINPTFGGQNFGRRRGST